MKNTEAFLSDLRELNIHISAEGERLRCKAPKGKLTPELQAKLAERKTEIIQFLQMKAIFEQPIQPISRDGELPISFTQERMWFMDKLVGGETIYNMPFAAHMDGSLNHVAIEPSLREIMQRHETLRTTFSTINGKPVVVIHQLTDYQLPITDLQGLSVEKQEVEVQRLVTEDAQRPFDLENFI